jgi:hypothetical protein
MIAFSHGQDARTTGDSSRSRQEPTIVTAHGVGCGLGKLPKWPIPNHGRDAHATFHPEADKSGFFHTNPLRCVSQPRRATLGPPTSASALWLFIFHYNWYIPEVRVRKITPDLSLSKLGQNHPRHIDGIQASATQFCMSFIPHNGHNRVIIVRIVGDK